MNTMNKDEINDLLDEFISIVKTGKEKGWNVREEVIALMNIASRRDIADAINNLADAIRERK